MTSTRTDNSIKDLSDHRSVDTNLSVGDATYRSLHTLQVRDMVLPVRRHLCVESRSS